MSIFRRRLAEGERVPYWWANTYYDPLTNYVICYPVGIHFLVRWWRDFRFWFWHLGHPGYRQRIEEAVWRAGYEARAACEQTAAAVHYQRGRLDGYEEANRDIQRAFNVKL